MSTEPQNVFLAIPTHDGRIDTGTAMGMLNASQEHQIYFDTGRCSLLAHGFNQLYCQALNMRSKNNLQWFAMLHSDIAPERLWLDKLIDLADEHGADLLSAIVPIKNHEGLTSTAITKDDGKTVWKRLTQTEVHSKNYPYTFSIDDLQYRQEWTKGHPSTIELPGAVYGHRLLVNTGCMIMRIDRPWSDEVFFTITDRIDHRFGTYTAHVDPEDWNLSRMVADKGGKVMATSAIKLKHIGATAYHSDAVWGKETDPMAEI